MSPMTYSTYSNLFWVMNDGQLISTVFNTAGVRPVINLSADVTISSGDGTMNNPYVVS